MSPDALAMVGAIAGAVGAVTGIIGAWVAIVTAMRDKPKVRVRIVRTAPQFFQDDQKHFIYIELMNTGTRVARIYPPDLRLLSKQGVPWYHDPHDWIPPDGSTWIQFHPSPTQKPMELQERETVPFFFRIDLTERPLFVEFYDCLYKRHRVWLSIVSPFITLRTEVRWFNSRQLRQQMEDLVSEDNPSKPRRRS